MIIDEKVIMPPYDPSAACPPSPAYPYASQPRTSPASSSYGSTVTLQLPRPPKLTSLPAHILLQIIHHTFPYSTPQVPAYNPSASAADAGYFAAYTAYYHPDTVAERQRRTLLWLSTSLRRVSRTLYTACMHVLRSTYLPAYLALVRPPYTSDPFPMDAPEGTPGSSSAVAAPPPAYASLGSGSASASSLSLQPRPAPPASPLISPQRETPILDRFILLKIRHDVLADESSLHLDREDAFRDLFEVAQPRARLEDLVREIAVRRGVVCVPGWGSSSSSSSSSSEVQEEAGTRQPRRVGSNGSLPAQTSGQQAEVRGAGYAPAQVQRQKPLAVEVEGPAVPKKKPVSTRKSFFSFSTRKTAPAPSSPPPSSPRSGFTSSSSPSSTPASNYAFNDDSDEKSPPMSPASPTSPLPSPPPQYSSATQANQIQPLPFPALSISFQPRRIGLLLGRTRTIAEVPRAPGRRETLEVLAARLVIALEMDLRGG